MQLAELASYKAREIYRALKNNVYVKRMDLLHFIQNIICGFHAVTTLRVIWNNTKWYYFVTTNSLPPECVGIVNVARIYKLHSGVFGGGPGFSLLRGERLPRHMWN